MGTVMQRQDGEVGGCGTSSLGKRWAGWGGGGEGEGRRPQEARPPGRLMSGLWFPAPPRPPLLLLALWLVPT